MVNTNKSDNNLKNHREKSSHVKEVLTEEDE